MRSSVGNIPDDVARAILEAADGPRPVALDEPADEEAFMAAVIALAKENGFRHFHPRDSRKSVAGWPDLVLVKPGRILFAELKSPKGRTTAAQDGWIELLRSAGCEVYVWRWADWHTIVETLK